MVVVFSLVNGHFAGKRGDANVWPVTYLMLQAVEGGATLFYYIVATLYGGELIWRERDCKFSGIHDALPMGGTIDGVSRFLSICVVELFLLTITMACGVVMQTVGGYHHYEFLQYFKELYLVTFPSVMTFALLALFVGAIGKSAQIPLYVWLPDAMEGPTPVSALIHAATMVTAGVYMIARSAPLYLKAPIAMDWVAGIGLATAFFAATIGMVQTDIKRVFAYSTVSQLGYMFLGVGTGAFGAGIFHLVTHAFFKALLFLGAGSVIHALSGEQDMRRMGGLRTKTPVTFWTMLAAAAAISALPFTSGFFSKDEILLSAWHRSPILFWIGIVTAAMTSFYVFRAIFLVFFGEYRGEAHAHESPPVMTVPLALLAVLSLAGGAFQVSKWLAPMFPEIAPAENPMLLAASIGAACGGVLVAWALYWWRPALPDMIARRLKWLYHAAFRKYWVDEIYAATVVRPLVGTSREVLWRGIDVEGHAVVIWVRQRDELVPRYVKGESFRLFSHLRIPIGQGLSGWVAENHRQIVNGNPAVESGYLDDPTKVTALRSAIAVPLQGREEVVGVLTLYRLQPEAFTLDHRRILLNISPKVGVVIENALKFEHVQHEARLDELTGLLNFRALFEQLEQRVKSCAERAGALAVIVLDLDGFKKANDEHGHLAGNRVLQLVAAGLKKCCRSHDLVARLGGDEFVLVLSDPGDYLDTLTDRINDVGIRAGAEIGCQPPLAISAGYAVYPADATDAESLLEKADERMYEDKRQRKANRPPENIVVFPKGGAREADTQQPKTVVSA